MLDNLFVPDPPAGDSSNRIPTTRFVRAVASAAITGTLTAASLITDMLSGLIVNPQNQDYRITERTPIGLTMVNFAGKTSAGSLTATLKINATAVTGGALNVTSSQGTTALTAANVMTTGDAMVLTISAATTPANFSFTIAYTRALS